MGTAMAMAATLLLAAGAGEGGDAGECLRLADGAEAPAAGPATCQRASAAASARGDASAEGRLRTAEGRLLFALGRLGEARDAFHRALLAAAAAGDAEQALWAQGWLCRVEARLDARAALDSCGTALARSQEASHAELTSYALTNLGLARAALGRHAEARDAFERSLAAHRARGDRRSEAEALGNLGAMHRAMAEFEPALARFEEARALRRQAEDRPGEAATLFNIGGTLVSLGLDERALEHFRESLALARELGFVPGQANNLTQIGLVEARLGREAGGLSSLDEALALRRKGGDRRGEARTLLARAQVLEALGRPGEAEAQRAGALPLFAEVGDHQGEAAALGALGDASRVRGQHADALERYYPALAAARQVGDRALEGSLEEGLLGAWSGLGQPALAILHGKRAVNLLQSLREGIRGLDRETRRAFLARRASAYRGLAGLLLDEGRLPEAQQVLGWAQEEELAGYLPAEPGGPEERIALDPAERAEARRIDEALGRPELPLEELRRGPGPALAGRARSGGAPLAEAEAPPAGAAAVYTLVAADRVRLLLVAARGRTLAESPVERGALARLVLALREALRDPSRDARPPAQALHRLLLGPLEPELRRLRPRALVWSLDGALRHLPVAALHDGRRWLVERYPTALLSPGPPGRRAAPGRWSAWAFGLSRAHPGFGPLPAVPGELRAVVRGAAASAGALEGDFRLDEEFTRDAFLGALGGARRPVVHVASHFRFQPGAPADSFLLLGDGSRLTLAEVARHPRLFEGVEVLTLSACETGLHSGDGEDRHLEGFAALARREGASAVLASLWPVEDESTGRLMAGFYRRLTRRSAGRAEALQAAQLGLLRGAGPGAAGPARGATPARSSRGGAGTAHPHYWAPFVLLGEWR